MLQKKQSFCLAFFVIVMFFGFCAFSQAAFVEVKPGFNDQYTEYLKNLPAPTTLNGLTSSDLSEVIPSYKMPFSVLKINFNPVKKLSYAPGEKMNLPANLSYVWKGSDNMKKIHDLCMEKIKDEAQCKTPIAYEIPEFNNLGVYVQVWRKDEATEGANKGDFLIDEFYALNDTELSENDKEDFNINWTVPAELKGGKYYFLFYLNQDKSFDILGTPLAVSSEYSRFDFEIKNSGSNGIELDKNNIKINSGEYAYRRPAPNVKGNEVIVEIPLANLNGNNEQANIKYELYRWGRTNPQDLIDSKTENKVLKANSTETLKYTFTPSDTDSVYDLKIKATTAKSESSSYVRFVMDGEHRGIFRFLSFVKDSKGDMTPMFCVRDANWSGSFQGTVKLTMRNEKFEQAGTINADDGKCFVLNNKLRVKNGECASVKGEIFDKAGKLVDTKNISVNCSKEKTDSAPVNQTIVDRIDKNLIYILIFLVFLLAGGVIILKFKDKK